MTDFLNQIKTASILLLIFSILTGIIYPGFITFIAEHLFPFSANGSLIKENNSIVGSLWIGQAFSNNKYFWGRPSATQPFPYNSLDSTGSNLGPSNPLLLDQIKKRVELYKTKERKNAIPIDLVTSSGSGLDPEISPYAAFYQVTRIAQTRHLSEQIIRELIEKHVKKRTFDILGEPRVNVLTLNLALDHLRQENK